jgi:Leucine-rich repeat (LRR) protein
LRTLLLLLTLICLLGGWYINRVHRQCQAVAWLREIGGIVSYNELTFDEENDLIITEPGEYPPRNSWAGKLAQQIGVDYVAAPQAASVDFLQASNPDDYRQLEKLPSLQVLYLWGSDIRDLRPVGKLRQLKVLYLLETPCDNLRPLAGLVELRQLSLAETPVQDLSPLAGLKNLRNLDLSKAPVSDLAPLRSLPNLRSLDLSATPNLVDLAPLAEIKSLEKLSLADTDATDFRPLHSLCNLEQLTISGPRVDSSTRAELKAALPLCQVIGPSVTLCNVQSSLPIHSGNGSPP